MKFIYFFFALLLIVSIIMAIQSFNLIYSVFWLVISFTIGSFIIFLNGLIEISLLILIIYGGAISIMFIFAIMMINLNRYGVYNFYKIDSILIYLLVITITFFSFYIIIDNNNFVIFSITEAINYKSLLKEVSHLFYLNEFILFISCAFVLLVPMINVLILI